MAAAVVAATADANSAHEPAVVAPPVAVARVELGVGGAADVPDGGVPDVPDIRRVDRKDVADIDCDADIGIGGVPFPAAPDVPPFPDVPGAQNTGPKDSNESTNQFSRKISPVPGDILGPESAASGNLVHLRAGHRVAVAHLPFSRSQTLKQNAKILVKFDGI